MYPNRNNEEGALDLYLDDVLSLCDKYGLGWDIYSHDGAEFS